MNINPATVQTKNQMTDINTTIALTRCDLNTTNILNNISEFST